MRGVRHEPKEPTSRPDTRGLQPAEEKKRALVAIAAEMLKVVYHMLKDGTVYQELGEDYMVTRRKDAQIKYHREQLNKLLGEDSPEAQSA